jgi:tetratricopeptide (TPR) repeat protein
MYKFTYYFIEGCKERMKGNFELAEKSFTECFKIDPNSAAVMFEIATIKKYKGQHEIALRYSKDCALQDPKNEWYQLLYIECLHNTKQYSQAADVYIKLVKNYPNRAEFYEGLAAEYMYAQNFEKSFKIYEELETKFGQNEAFTLNKIIREIELVLEKPLNIENKTGEYSLIDVPVKLDISKMVAFINWEPEIELKDGINKKII